MFYVLIRTLVIEVVKSDVDVARLIKNFLLKSIEKFPEVTERANKILVNHCYERCLIRIRPGN